jgi:lipoprotein-releasing system ATP-binding protein
MSERGELVLKLSGVIRRYRTGAGDLVVLDGADLDLRAGEVVGLVGPSGSGKSSLLHVAGLLERPDGGDVWVDGEDCLKLNDDGRTRVRRSKLGFVYQFHHLLPEFTACDNIVLPQMIAGRSKGEARARALDLLDRVGLRARADHQPAQLSGGEQQRVALARALANRPRVVLADEPTGNLDPATSHRVFEMLQSLARRENVAVLAATHNLELTRFMDRVLALNEGKLAPRSPVGEPPVR